MQLDLLLVQAVENPTPYEVRDVLVQAGCDIGVEVRTELCNTPLYSAVTSRRFCSCLSRQLLCSLSLKPRVAPDREFCQVRVPPPMTTQLGMAMVSSAIQTPVSTIHLHDGC